MRCEMFKDTVLNHPHFNHITKNSMYWVDYRLASLREKGTGM